MSLITELVNLVIQLDSMRLDDRVRELVLPIKELSIRIQQEMTDLDRRHLNEMTNLHADNTALRIQNADIAAKHSVLQIEHATFKASQSPTLPDSPSTPDHSVTPRSFDNCPFCRKDSGVLTGIFPHSRWSRLGKMTDHFKCSQCHQEYQKNHTD